MQYGNVMARRVAGMMVLLLGGLGMTPDSLAQQTTEGADSERQMIQALKQRVEELEARLAKDGHDFEWADVIQDLDRLQMVEVEQDSKRFLLRSEVEGMRLECCF